MINQSVNKRDKRVLMNLIIIILMGTGLFTSCTSKPIKQIENKISQQAETAPRETPVALQPTKENKGKRCGTEGTTTSENDEAASNTFCHDVQLKLLKAAGAGDLEKIREALREGANPNGAVDDRFPPLQQAAASGKVDAVRLLLDNGADVNLEADFQNTALSFAVYEGHIDVVRVLIERGADVCYRTDTGTYEELARRRGYQEIAELLKAAIATKCR